MCEAATLAALYLPPEEQRNYFRNRPKPASDERIFHVEIEVNETEVHTNAQEGQTKGTRPSVSPQTLSPLLRFVDLSVNYANNR